MEGSGVMAGVLTGFVGERSPTDTPGQTRPRVESHVSRATGVGSQNPGQNGSWREENRSGASTSSSGGRCGCSQSAETSVCQK